MTPEAFKEKWQAAVQSEAAGAHEHFIDLCRLLEVPTPTEADPSRTWYRFEKNALKLDGRPGRADVWRKGCFAWEYKGDKKNLTDAYGQLKKYADALENPPLLIVSDMREIRIHTNFTNTIAQTLVFQLADLNGYEARQKLKWAFTDPERLRPQLTRERVTAAAATAFGRIAQKLIGQGYDRKRVAHFLNKLVFCLFSGIEINPYAAELARVTIWIGELQWQLRNGFGIHRSPILGALPGIECRDALLNPDGTEAEWPEKHGRRLKRQRLLWRD